MTRASPTGPAPGVEDVAVEDHEVGKLSLLDRAGLVLEEVDVGGAVGLGGQRRREVEPLVGEHGLPVALGMGDPRDGDLHDRERVRRRDGPVAPEGERCPGADEAPERIVVGGALADEREGEIVDVRAVRGPVRLGVRDDAELGESRLVVGMDQLDVREVVARVAPAVCLLSRLDRVKGFSDGAVADRVQMHLEAVRVEQDEHSP